MPTELRDVAAGLWIWRTAHHHWKPAVHWQEVVERVIISHGEPVHDRAAFERALERPAWRA